MCVLALSSALTLYSVVPAGNEPDGVAVTTLTRNGGTNPSLVSANVPSDAVVPVRELPVASTSVTAAPPIAAPSDVVPCTLVCTPAITVSVEQLHIQTVLHPVP